MLFEDIFMNWKYWNDYRDKLVLDKYIIQTSTKKDLDTPRIKIRNFVMMKQVDGFIDFRPSYFNKHRAMKNILIEQFDKLFGEYLIVNSQYLISHNPDLIINDYMRDVFIKEVIKDLAIIEYDKKVALLFFGDVNQINLKEVGHFIKHEDKGFAVFDIELLRVYDLEDLQAYFGLTYKKINARRLLNSIIRIFEREQKISNVSVEEEEFTALFSKNNLNTLRTYDFEKYLYFNEDYKIPRKKIINLGSVGSTGSGKTFTLNLILLQYILAGDFKRIIYFDTQDSFENGIMYNVNPLYLSRAKRLSNCYFKITEDDFYLNEVDAVNCINFLLETKGYNNPESKRSVTYGVEYDDWDAFKEVVGQLLEEERNRLKVDKDLNKMEDLEAVKKFMEKVRVSKSSIFEDLEVQNKFFAIFSFQNTLFYEVSCYLYLQKLKDILRDRTEGYTFFFADETQKYLGSAFLKKVLLDLVKEKRQFGFRFHYSGLSYQDVNDFVRFTQHIVFNSFNDPFMLNQLKSMSKVPIESMKTPIEKVINDTSANEVKKTQLRMNILNKTSTDVAMFQKIKKKQEEAEKKKIMKMQNDDEED